MNEKDKEKFNKDSKDNKLTLEHFYGVYLKINGKINGRISGKIDGNINGNMNGRIDEKINGNMNARIDDKINTFILSCELSYKTN